jgi:hypothetical protein
MNPIVLLEKYMAGSDRVKRYWVQFFQRIVQTVVVRMPYVMKCCPE